MADIPDDDDPNSSFLAELRLVLGFLTRLPLPPLPQAPVQGGLAVAMRAFPLAGAVIGLIGGGLYVVASALLPPLVAASLALAGTVAVTGALHEDGLGDVADGFGGGHDRETKLAIMRDSRIGSYGVVVVALGLLLRVGALAGLHPWMGLAALVGAHALSRAAIPLVMRRLVPARTDGLGHGAGIPTETTARWAAALALAVTFLTLPLGAAAMAVTGAVAGAAIVSLLAVRHIGGFTGDVLGAVEQAAETLALVFVVAAS